MSNQSVTPASNYFDLQGLDQLRQKALANDKGAIREVANQFEAMFATMLIKSMREANEAFETDSPFNNKQTKFYTDMQDKQLALDISRHGSLGLADALVRQLDPTSIAGSTESVPLDQLQMPNTYKTTAFPIEKESTAFAINQKAAPMEFSMADRAPKVKSSSETLAFTDKKSFINTLLPYAKKVAKVLGISPEVLIAQSALETGWGKKIINDAQNNSSFNLFNIKANASWSGGRVAKESIEVENGVAVKRRSHFRAYENIAQSFNDYAQFIGQSKRYQGALEQGTNGSAYIEKLQQAGYATDPLYATKVQSIMQSESFKEILKEDKN
ncbi:flagellar rod assembly protein/muramidase FlgJ [Psychromonas sp. CNPT3]|uniref:flagellar assembly peptidoglycan hydrolase FlgJ n=1 Tax=Psychromonas sp. CNPT3 TaxID=314282 RepID=UPI00006E3499|nr:flagellar assembly peptidoglycan hydrolase FlgJ [Psychromonas sp. CNPT3]AGH80574.1 flagellar rod assembly protein/muramidase FlgJ [Psychromonas sp. CNPT3]